MQVCCLGSTLGCTLFCFLSPLSSKAAQDHGKSLSVPVLYVPEKVNYKAKRTQALSGFLGNIQEESGKAEEITLTSTEMQIYMRNVFLETQSQ